MDIATLIFVGGLCLVALVLTLTVRHELLAKERRQREERRESQHTSLRRKP
jgi:hypothetical protein